MAYTKRIKTPDELTISNFNRAARPVKTVYNNSAKVGKELRLIRKERGVTLMMIADRAGVTKAVISRIERGESKTNIDMFDAVFSALGIELWEILLKINLEKGKERKPYSHYKSLFESIDSQSLHLLDR